MAECTCSISDVFLDFLILILIKPFQVFGAVFWWNKVRYFVNPIPQVIGGSFFRAPSLSLSWVAPCLDQLCLDSAAEGRRLHRPLDKAALKPLRNLRAQEQKSQVFRARQLGLKRG